MPAPANVSTRSVKTIMATAQTLFEVAEVQLGDATQWNRIAKLNRLTDPWLDGPVKLAIPDRDPTGGNGGIVSP